MSEDDTGDGEREFKAKAFASLQAGMQLLIAGLQLYALIQQARDKTQAEQQAQAVREQYDADAAQFRQLNDPKWWDQATPEDIKASCEAAQRWAEASPEAARAARFASAQIVNRDIHIDGVDPETLAEAKTDPQAARNLASTLTGDTSKSTSEGDPNTAVVREALKDRADEFLYLPGWGKLSEQINAATIDGRYNVHSLITEADQWRNYGPSDRHVHNRDKASLLAWRINDFLTGDGGGWTRQHTHNSQPINPEPAMLVGDLLDPEDVSSPESSPSNNPTADPTVIDGEVLNPETPPASGDTEYDPYAVAFDLDDLMDESPMPPLSTDDAPFVVDGSAVNQPGEYAPDASHQDRLAEYLHQRWPEGSSHFTSCAKWPRLADRLKPLHDEGVDVTTYLQGLAVDWEKIKFPAAYAAAIIDKDPPQKTTTAPRPEVGSELNSGTAQRPSPGEQASPAAIEIRHKEVVEALKKRWPTTADDITTSPQWPRLAGHFDRLRDNNVDVTTVLKNATFDLESKSHPAAYLTTVLEREHIGRIEQQEDLREKSVTNRDANRQRATERALPRPDKAVVDSDRRARNREIFEQARHTKTESQPTLSTTPPSKDAPTVASPPATKAFVRRAATVVHQRRNQTLPVSPPPPSATTTPNIDTATNQR